MVQKLTRRQFNTALAASAALAAFGLPRARAGVGPLIVGTWGCGTANQCVGIHV